MPKASDTKIKELDRKLGTIMSRLETIEKILSDSLEHPELASTISNLRAGVLLVKEPIAALDRLSAARKYLHQRSVEKDELSRLIIQTLALEAPPEHLSDRASLERSKRTRLTQNSEIQIAHVGQRRGCSAGERQRHGLQARRVTNCVDQLVTFAQNTYP